MAHWYPQNSWWEHHQENEFANEYSDTPSPLRNLQYRRLHETLEKVFFDQCETNPYAPTNTAMPFHRRARTPNLTDPDFSIPAFTQNRCRPTAPLSLADRDVIDRPVKSNGRHTMAHITTAKGRALVVQIEIGYRRDRPAGDLVSSPERNKAITTTERGRDGRGATAGETTDRTERLENP